MSENLLPSQATRVFALAVAATGGLSVALAGPVSSWVAQVPSARPDPRIVAVLGARQLAQGALLATVPDPAISRLGAATDGRHAATMVLAAVIWPRYRRAAVVSGSLAAVSAAAGLRLARRQTDDPR